MSPRHPERYAQRAVMIVAWLPVPMAIAAGTDVALREFGRGGRDGTVPRAVASSFALWLIAVGACLLPGVF